MATKLTHFSPKETWQKTTDYQPTSTSLTAPHFYLTNKKVLARSKRIPQKRNAATIPLIIIGITTLFVLFSK